MLTVGWRSGLGSGWLWVVPLWLFCPCLSEFTGPGCLLGQTAAASPPWVQADRKWMTTAEPVSMWSGLPVPRGSASLTAAIFLESMRCFKWAQAKQQVPDRSDATDLIFSVAAECNLLLFLNGRWVCQQSGQKNSKTKLLLWVKAKTYFLLPHRPLPPCRLTDRLLLHPDGAFAAGPAKWPDRIDDGEVVGGIKPEMKVTLHTIISIRTAVKNTYCLCEQPWLCFAPQPLVPLFRFLILTAKKCK